MTVAATIDGMAGQMPGWRELELGAPEISRLGMARLDASGVAMLGTVRQDGSPRISPVEPHFASGCLLVGAMSWSGKAADLRRDPRYLLHSAVTSPDSGEGELKLRGTAAEVSPDQRAEVPQAWWSAQPPGKAIVFMLNISQAVFITWDLAQSLMTVHRWSPQAGYSQNVRAYP